MTVTGKTVAENLAGVSAVPPEGQDVVLPINQPKYPHGHLAILKGNLAEEGAVAKISGLKSTKMTGPARVFNSEEEAMDAIMQDSIPSG